MQIGCLEGGGLSLLWGWLVERGALYGDATSGANDVLHLRGWQFLAEFAARGTGDALVHEGTAEVVCTRAQAGFHAVRAHFDPRDLDVGDVGVEHQAGNRVHEDCFAEGWPFARPSFPIDGCLHMDKGQGDKFCEAAGACLQRFDA